MVQKSCTTWDVLNPVNNGIFTISIGDRRISSINSMLPSMASSYPCPLQQQEQPISTGNASADGWEAVGWCVSSLDLPDGFLRMVFGW